MDYSFGYNKSRGRLQQIVDLGELIHNSTVRKLRASSRIPLVGLITSIMQTLVLVAAFYVMFNVIGLRSSPIKGSFVLYLFTGIFLYMTHLKGLTGAAGAEGPTSPLMQHAPMTPFIAITGSVLSSLYIQVLAVIIVLFLYHNLVEPIEIYRPTAAFGMILLAWGSGVAVGLVFYGASPFSPGIVGIAKTIYMRVSMIASGKMFLANQTPSQMRNFLDWHPLFSVTDQARGFAFLNYTPHYTNVLYPLKVTLVLIMIGILIQFVARQRASLSWHSRGM